MIKKRSKKDLVFKSFEKMTVDELKAVLYFHKRYVSSGIKKAELKEIVYPFYHSNNWINMRRSNTIEFILS